MKAFRNLHQTAVAVLLVVYLLPVSLAAQSGPKIVEVVSPGGLKAWLVRDSAVPVIALRFSMRGAGGAVDPVGKKGLSNMVSGLIDEGAGELDSLAFQTKLEERAISLRFSSGRDGFRGNLRTLSEYRAEAFEMMRLALTAPRFDAEPVERIRRQIITGLIRDQEDPDTVAARAWYKAAFPVHPYGLPPRRHHRQRQGDHQGRSAQIHHRAAQSAYPADRCRRRYRGGGTAPACWIRPSVPCRRRAWPARFPRSIPKAPGKPRSCARKSRKAGSFLAASAWPATIRTGMRPM